MIRYLLVKREDEKQDFDSVSVLPLEQQKLLADYDIDAYELAYAFQLHLGHAKPMNEKSEQYYKEIVAAFTSGDYYILPYDDHRFEIFLDDEEQADLVIADELLIHTSRNAQGYVVDVFDNHEQNDDGLFSTTTVWDDDLS